MTNEEELEGALELLGATNDVESDEYDEATSVLLAQTRADLPALLPRLFALSEAKPRLMRQHLVETAAALLCRTMKDPPGPHDAPLQALIASRTDELVRWRDDERAIAAASIAVHYKVLRDIYVERLERRADLSAADWLVLVWAESVPSWVWPRAHAALRSTDSAIRCAAALVAVRQAPLPPEVGTQLDAILVPGALLAINKVLVLSDLGVPALPKGPFGPVPDARVDGTVVFAGANLVTLRIEGGNVTLRFRPESLFKGDAVRLGRDAGGRPRVLEWTTADGSSHREDVAPDGTRHA